MSVSAWANRQLRRSPLKTSPLRLPGQSGDERIHELRDTFYEDVTVTLCLVTMALMQWVQWWFELPPRPIPVTVLALSAIVYVWKKGVPLKQMIGNLKLGRDGERVVGQMLEQLRQYGYRVFHDIPGDGWNIDHVIVGPGGIFTIETKMRSKPAQGNSKILYDGHTIKIGHGQPVNNPLTQARAQATWLGKLLNDGRTVTFAVHPVVVFPEWYVEQTGPRNKNDVWVLNPKMLVSCLAQKPRVLSDDRIDAAAHALTQHSRRPVEQSTAS